MTNERQLELAVAARDKWIDTGLDLRAGESISFAASGTRRDLTFVSGPEGYAASAYMKPFERFRWNPRGRWFELTGCIDKDIARSFAIGQRPSIACPANGRLYLFPNDVPGFYSNTSGALTVRVQVGQIDHAGEDLDD